MYKNKYLKYKDKYLNLKGGSQYYTNNNIVNIKRRIKSEFGNFMGYNISKCLQTIDNIPSNFNDLYGILSPLYYLFDKDLDDDDVIPFATAYGIFQYPRRVLGLYQ